MLSHFTCLPFLKHLIKKNKNQVKYLLQCYPILDDILHHLLTSFCSSFIHLSSDRQFQNYFRQLLTRYFIYLHRHDSSTG